MSQLTKSELQTLKDKYRRPEHIPHPAENPFSVQKFHLGRTLFFDPRISKSGITSCATCHNPSLSWGDGLPTGIGDEHQALARKTPTIENLAWDELFFWDGRAESLEQQALMPIVSTQEMNISMSKVIEKLKSIEGYAPLIKSAFKEEGLSERKISQALATFMRQQVSPPAPFDRWIEGEENAISNSAKQGFVLFNGKGNCATCHSGWRFSDGSFHDIGLKTDDVGRGEHVTRIPAMQHAFKTVGLRNIELRAPYMHDGSLPTLQAVLDHYNDGMIERESLSADIKPLHLTQEEKANIIEFLKTLTSETEVVQVPVLPT